MGVSHRSCVVYVNCAFVDSCPSWILRGNLRVLSNNPVTSSLLVNLLSYHYGRKHNLQVRDDEA